MHSHRVPKRRVSNSKSPSHRSCQPRSKKVFSEESTPDPSSTRCANVAVNLFATCNRDLLTCLVTGRRSFLRLRHNDGGINCSQKRSPFSSPFHFAFACSSPLSSLVRAESSVRTASSSGIDCRKQHSRENLSCWRPISADASELEHRGKIPVILRARAAAPLRNSLAAAAVRLPSERPRRPSG